MSEELSPEELDKLASELYDFVSSRRKDNKSKNPREIGCEFNTLFEEVKEHYRNCIRFFQKNEKEIQTWLDRRSN